MLGTLTVGASGSPFYINTGTIEARGNVVVGPNVGGGSSTISFLVAGNQTITGGAGILPSTNIAKPSDTVSVTGDLMIRSFALSSGTFTAPTGTLTVVANGTYTAWSHTGGTFNHNNGTVKFDFNGSNYGNTTTIAVPTTPTFNNLTFIISYFSTSWNITAGNTLIVLGTLSFPGNYYSYYVNTGTIEARGNVIFSGSSFSGGTAALSLTGTSTQSITYTAGTLPNGAFTVNKTSGGVTTVGAVTFPGAVTITSGLLCLTSNTTFNNTVTINSNGTLVIDGYSVTTTTTPTLNAGSTVSYTGGTNAVTVKNWAYKRFTINAPGKQFNWSTGVTYTVSEAFNVRGASGSQRVTLRSASEGTQWRINTTGAATDIAYADVKDSVSTVLITAHNSVNSGNNINWKFSSPGAMFSIQ